MRRYSQTEKVYQGATLNNVITGKVDFNADIIWHDGANEASRKNNTNPGGIVLWRYTNESGNDTPADRERSAQAETGSLVKTDENGQVVLGTDGKPVYLDKIEFKNLEKYDRFGNPYVYYAKETLDSNLGNYQAVYSDTDCAKNNGSITNNLAGTRNFVVEAEWKAAARQGGDASVTYVVQDAIKNDQGEITGWKNVGTPMMDAEGNYLKVKLDSEGNPVYEGGKLYMKLLLTLKKHRQLPDLP